LLGFLDAYISGDGSVTKPKLRVEKISMSSVSLKMLSRVQLILKNLGVIGKIHKPKKPETNNRGSKDIKQGYELSVTNEQSKILAGMLNLSIKSKQERIATILEQKHGAPNFEEVYNIYRKVKSGEKIKKTLSVFQNKSNRVKN
jgi:hypothetical protein